MTVSTEQQNTAVRLWLLLPRVGDAMQRCFDVVFGKYGISNEQTRVLSLIKSQGPMRPIDMAFFLERAPNSMSMLVDRMVKAGLVRRTRDRKDRRAVFVSLTSKGEEAVVPAIPAGWEFVKKLVSSLSYDDQCALADMLETLKCQLTRCLNPEMDEAEAAKKSLTRTPNLYRQMLNTFLSPGQQSPSGGKKRKTVRRK